MDHSGTLGTTMEHCEPLCTIMEHCGPLYRTTRSRVVIAESVSTADIKTDTVISPVITRSLLVFLGTFYIDLGSERQRECDIETDREAEREREGQILVAEGETEGPKEGHIVERESGRDCTCNSLLD